MDSEGGLGSLNDSAYPNGRLTSVGRQLWGLTGVKPADVKFMAVSHTHPDHVGNVEMFILSIVYGAVFTFSGIKLSSHANLRVASGLLYSLAAFMTPIAVYAVEKLTSHSGDSSMGLSSVRTMRGPLHLSHSPSRRGGLLAAW